MIIVEFEEEALRHWCAKNHPDVNKTMNIDHLICARAFMFDEECLLCKSFEDSIELAIRKEASRRLPLGGEREKMINLKEKAMDGELLTSSIKVLNEGINPQVVSGK